MEQLFIRTRGHCFLCLDNISSKSTVEKLDYDADPDSQSDSDRISAFYATHSLRHLSHYLKMSLREVKALNGSISSKKVGLKVILCEDCALLNERFSEQYRQLEKARMEVESSLTDIAERLAKAEGVGGKSLDGLLSEKETGIVEAVRKETMQTCLLKIDGIVPRITLKRLTSSEMERRNDLVDLKSCPSVPLPEPGVEESPLNQFIPFEDELLMGIMSKDDAEISHGYASVSASVHGNKKESGLRTRSQEENSSVLELPRSEKDIPYIMDPETGRYVCLTCGKSFRSEFHTLRHSTVVHLGTKFKCEFCVKEFSWKHTLTRHYRMRHHTSLDKNFKCDFCNTVEFGSESALNSHQQLCACRDEARKEGSDETTAAAEELVLPQIEPCHLPMASTKLVEDAGPKMTHNESYPKEVLQTGLQQVIPIKVGLSALKEWVAKRGVAVTSVEAERPANPSRPIYDRQTEMFSYAPPPPQIQVVPPTPTSYAQVSIVPPSQQFQMPSVTTGPSPSWQHQSYLSAPVQRTYQHQRVSQPAPTPDPDHAWSYYHHPIQQTAIYSAPPLIPWPSTSTHPVQQYSQPSGFLHAPAQPQTWIYDGARPPVQYHPPY